VFFLIITIITPNITTVIYFAIIYVGTTTRATIAPTTSVSVSNDIINLGNDIINLGNIVSAGINRGVLRAYIISPYSWDLANKASSGKRFIIIAIAQKAA
jgi:hypothetical protein